MTKVEEAAVAYDAEAEAYPAGEVRFSGNAFWELGFLTLPRVVSRNTSLSAEAKIVYAVMYEMFNSREELITLDDLIRDAGIHRLTLDKRLKELLGLGYVAREKSGGMWVYSIKLSGIPEPR